ncbi:MAG: FAD-dependent oxidoreductase [Acidobacteriota bacterium]
MSGETALAGPDLTLGIETSDIPQSGMIVGHVSGEAVLVCRTDAGLFAVGATCTHYGGPLAEGMLTDTEIHCPWHHGTFDLRNASVVSPPPFNPLQCWRTELQGDRIIVREKVATQVSPSSIDTPSSMVILGGGAAGHSAAETLRREGYRGSIRMISADRDLPFDKPNLSKDYLAGTAPEEWIPLRDAAFYRQQEIAVKLNTRVTSIDVDGRSIRTDEGESISYDRLLMATGADPFVPPIAGATLSHVHLLRTFRDSQAIIAAASKARRAVVIGAGFIGLEVAASLIARGLSVDVIAPDEVPLGRVLGSDLGSFVQKIHEEKGVRFHLDAAVSTIKETGVVLADGQVIECDLVVIGTGVRPATGLAEAAGILVDEGILVDQFLQTSAPGVYAAGDLARWRDERSGELRRVEHWAVAQRHGQIAARNMLGNREPCSFAPFFWSAHYDVVISYVGYAPKWDVATLAGDLEARNARVTYRSDGRVLAVATIFRDRESLAIEAAMNQGDIEELESIVNSPIV